MKSLWTTTAALAATAIVALTAVGVVRAEDKPPETKAPAKRREPGPPPAGLVLRAEAAATTVLPGAPLRVKVVLANESKQAIQVVRPGDGSDAGWREPVVNWTAHSVAADGTETRIERTPLLRCGNFAAEWTRDVVSLAAGATLDITDEFGWPTNRFDFQTAGRVRLRAEYEYRAGADARRADGKSGGTIDTGAMGATAPFRLVSNPVDIEVKRPIDVVVKVRRAAKCGVAQRPEDLLEVTAVGADGATVSLEPGAWVLTFEQAVSTCGADGWDETWKDPAKDAVTTGTSISLLGPRSPVRRVSYPWTFAQPGEFRVIASLAETKDLGCRIRSTAAVVKVE